LAWSGNPIASKRNVRSLPSGEPTHRRWLTREQLLQLYAGATGPGRLLVALEGFNGLRRVEVLRLRARDVALDEPSLRVLGKGRNGGKWRQVPVFPPVRRLLELALAGRAPSDRLFPLSKTGADRLLSRSAAAAGLTATGVKLSHHDLRRTFGRLAHSAGRDLIQLKNLFGHASVEMTVHYIGLDSDTMRAGLQRLSDALGPID
jgi:integrase